MLTIMMPTDINSKLSSCPENTCMKFSPTNIACFQKISCDSALKEDMSPGSVIGKILWNEPDSGALFEMELESKREQDLTINSKSSKKSKPTISSEKKSSEENSLERNGGINLDRFHQVVNKIANTYVLDDNMPLDAETSPRSWEALEQRHTKSKSISVPKKYRRSSSMF